MESKDGEEYYFIHSVKQFLCLSLSRNIVSVVPQIFDIAIQIFVSVLVNLRSSLKVYIHWVEEIRKNCR